MKRFLILLALACAVPASAGRIAYDHYLRGLLFERQGRYRSALSEYQATIGLDPDSTFVYQQALDLSLRLGQLPKAREYAERLISLDPQNPAGHVQFGGVLWSGGDVEGAEKSFKKALELDPDNIEATFHLANMLAPQRPRDAIERYTTYLDLNPGLAAETLLQIALLHDRLGETDKAQDALLKSIEKEPRFMQSRYALAQLFEVRGDTAAALAQYAEIAPLDPENTTLFNRMGEIHYKGGDVAAAQAAFKRAKTIDAADPTANAWLSLLAEKRGDFAAAGAFLRESSAFAEDVGLHLRLSYYLTQLDRFAEAVAALEAARAKWPDNADVNYFLALGYDDLERTPEAVTLLRKVLKERPQMREAKMQIAIMLEKTGDIVGAEGYFRDLLKTEPENPVVLNYLGYSLADRGLKLDEAEALIRKAVALRPKNGAYVDSLGWVHFKLGRTETALKELETAIELLPGDETIWEHLGEVHAALGAPAQAWSAFMRSLAAKPGREKIAKRARQLEANLSAEELGAGWLAYLAATHSGYTGLKGFCRLEGKVARQKFSFSGYLEFDHDGRLKLDVLGPFLAPLFTVRAEHGRVDLGGLELPGIEPERLQDSLGRLFGLWVGYLDGGLFEAPGASAERSWGKAKVTAGTAAFALADDVHLGSVEQDGFSLKFSAFDTRGSRFVPTDLEFSGPGIALRLSLDRWLADF